MRLGTANQSFELSRDGKTFFKYSAAPKCDYSNPTHRYVGESLEMCMRIRFVCAAGEQYFSDECGCGCEPAPKPCVVSGCSGQVCAESEMMTTCEYRAEYACYKTATCERDASGVCGWRKTEELSSCLSGAATF